MTNPVLKVEIAFDSDPMDITPTWTDVTADVRDQFGVQIVRGRPGQAGQSDNAGMCTFTLNNRGRLYDQMYAAGTYYGKLRARKQVRVTCTHSATTYPMFYGFTSGFPVTGAAMGMDSVVTVTAYDAISVLSGARLAGDPLLDYVRDTDLTLILRQADATTWANACNAYEAPHSISVAGALRPGPSMLPGMKSNTVDFDGTAYLDTEFRLVTGGSGYGVVMFWIKAAVEDAPLARENRDETGGQELTLRLGHLKFSTSTGSITSTKAINDGFPHHVAIVGSSVTSPTTVLYIDGVADVGTVDGTRPAVQPIVRRIGASANASGVAFTIAAGVTLQDFFHTQDMTALMPAATISTIFDLSRAVAVEATTSRMGRILNEVGWPDLWANYETAWRGEVSELLYNGQSAWTSLQEVERSEQGRIFVARDGVVTISGRYAWLEESRSNTVRATFSDDGSDEAYRTFAYSAGDDDVANDITVKTSTLESRSTDSASQDEYGTIADTINTNLSTYAQVAAMSDGVLYLRKDAAVRFAPMTVSPVDWADVLGLELHDRIAIESTPMGVGTQSVQEALVDSIEWDISAASGWWFTVAGSPIPVGSFWVLGVSTLGVDTNPGF